MRWGVFVAGMLAVLFSGGQAEAQDNAACDAACDVPCYFGECAPARASYKAALERCDVGRLEMVGRFYAGTVSGDKARDAAALLRARGYATSRIGVTPNSSGGAVQDCTALVDGNPVTPPENLCALINIPSGWRCEVRGGRAELIQDITPSTVTTVPAPAVPNDLGPRPASGIAATEYDRCVGGDASQCFNLGKSYQDGIDGVAQDDRRAVAAYRRSCDGEDAKGCTSLGYMYFHGRGVAQNDTRAVSLYRQGCDGGNAQGCFNLGFMYDQGRGIGQDYPRAVSLYRQGCDRGIAESCTNLGLMYELGKGVTQDYARGTTLQRQGCEGGNAGGCAGLGNNYRIGRGVTKDLAQAQTFLTRGCNAGSQWGCDRLKDLP